MCGTTSAASRNSTTFEERCRRSSTLSSLLRGVGLLMQCIANKKGENLTILEAKALAQRRLIALIQQELLAKPSKAVANSMEQLGCHRRTDGLIVVKRPIRGQVRQIRCDRGTNFVGASRELARAWKEMDRDSLKAILLECEWVFNPPAASHAGGVWERIIRSARRILGGLMTSAESRLTTFSLRTLMYEVMATPQLTSSVGGIP
ncbi:Gag-pol fusion polyprotein [Elysia marginata]|uniref:Gag-pol fusion polyprotein n=1 Tax=Elysia marginata TaxID=1093978 RepID=A0AAV4IXM9_9GAST|nr:Gag-pol fusion polyprotein [Elysia marginata]